MRRFFRLPARKSRTKSARRATRKVSFESLETKRPLAANFADGVLTITGTSRNDRIEVTLSGSLLKANVNGSARNFSASRVEFINISAGGGNDTILVSNAIKVRTRIEGGTGSDTIYGGSGRDLILGQSGNDNIFSRGGNDTVYGQSGNDRIFGGDGNDHTFGGDDDDSVYGNSGEDDVLGGEGDDKCEGGTGDDVIDGGDGSDDIHGNSGDDDLEGGNGNDDMDGGDGEDVMDGENGDDDINGEDDDDELHGGDGDDTIDGGNGDDYCDGGGDDDTMNGGEGDDIFDDEEGEDEVDDDDQLEHGDAFYVDGSLQELNLRLRGSGTLGGCIRYRAGDSDGQFQKRLKIELFGAGDEGTQYDIFVGGVNIGKITVGEDGHASALFTNYGEGRPWPGSFPAISTGTVFTVGTATGTVPVATTPPPDGGDDGEGDGDGEGGDD